VVAKLRSITGIKQIGHTGTLDPFATGLLICAVGQATKMVGIFDVLPKTYEATIQLGLVSDTYDRTGQVTSYKLQVTNQFQITNSKLQTVLESFIGEQLQTPPMYSAKKVQGKKLYELAHQGKEVERKPSEIKIYDIKIRNPKSEIINKFKIQNSNIQTFNIEVICSAGTYIRTLAHDIGQKLGTGAILSELKRTAIGDFQIDKAVQLSQLTKDNYSKYLIKPLEMLEVINLYYIKSI
jgi:tRNA pseudouridine55 synthase